MMDEGLADAKATIVVAGRPYALPPDHAEVVRLCRLVRRVYLTAAMREEEEDRIMAVTRDVVRLP